MGKTMDKATIERLERELLLIRAAFNSASDAIKIGDINGRSIYHNKTFIDLFGYSVDQLIEAGGPAALFYHRNIADEVLSSIAVGRSWSGEALIRTREGRVVITALRADQIRDHSNNALGLIGVFTDITDRKMAEDRYCDLVENSGVLIGTHDLNGNILTCNQSFVRFTGYQRVEDFPGRKLSDFLAPDVKHLFGAYLDHVRTAGHARGIMKTVTPVGETRLLEYDNSLRSEGPAVPIVRCFGHDVTAAKEAERKLRASEARHRALAETSSVAIITIDRHSSILFVNRAAEEIFGYRGEELLNKPLTILMPEYLRHLHESSVNHYIATGEKHLAWDSVELPGLHRSGREIPLELALGEFSDRDQRIFTAVVRDVSRRKEADEKLRRAHEFRENVMQSVTNAVAVLNQAGEIKLVNRRASEITGYEADELVGRPLLFLVHPARLIEFEKQVNKTLEQGIWVSGQETELIRKDGAARLIRFSLMPLLENDSVTGLVGTADDITELTRLQRERAEFEKLAWLGHMIAGAAHELRDPLNNIIGYAQWLQDYEDNEQTKFKLDVIIEEGKKAAGIVGDLLAFARHERLNQEEVDLNETLVRVILARSAELRTANIAVVYAKSPLPLVWAEGRLLERVFANIIVNAEQAMSGRGGGILTVRTRLKEADPGRVIVELSDTGPGIALEHLPRVFDPFFTTKRIGQGLGLSFSYGVVRMHGGDIHVESKYGHGARFTVEIPAAPTGHKDNDAEGPDC